MGKDYTRGRPEPREEIKDVKPKIADTLAADKKKKVKTKKMEKFLGLGGTSTSAQNPNSSTSQGTPPPPPPGESIADKINFGGKSK